MVRARAPLVEFAAWQTPMHADPQREYHWVAEWHSWQQEGQSVTLAARDEQGAALTVRLSFAAPAVLRVQLLTAGAELPPPTPMLLTEEWPRLTLAVEETATALRLRTSSMVVEIDRAPWRLRVSAAGKPLWEQEHADVAFNHYAAFPFGYSVSDDGVVAVHETFALAHDEHIYGLGGQYGPVGKRGQRHVSWLREAYGSNTNPVTYFEVPFFVSSRGYGIFVNHGERITYELGSPSAASASFQVDAPVLDYFLIAGADPKTVLRRYSDLTGRPALPPLWSFGVWMSRCMYKNRAEVEDSVERMRALDIPVDIYHLDPLWLRNRRHREDDGCDFVWDEEHWGSVETLTAWLAERGIKLSLWENPYVWTDVPLFDEGWQQGHFAKLPDGTHAPPTDEGGAGSALVDYTSPAAVSWMQDIHRHLLRQGVAAFKCDYGEATPVNAVFADGSSGARTHNLYPLLYQRALFAAAEAELGVGNAVVFSRAGYGGSQRYPLTWSGDAQASWAGMAGALRCGLSQAMSGIDFWTVDIGGFASAPGFSVATDPLLYIRWAQWGLLLSHSRFHGYGPREPWHFGEDAVRIVRDFIRLRYRLVPYLWALAHEAAERAVPVLRPLVLEFPDDPVAPFISSQYLLGPNLLVCPVLGPEGRVRVYLPPGRWHDWWDRSVYEGGRFLDLTVPLERLPLFVRDDSVLPLAPEGNAAPVVWPLASGAGHGESAVAGAGPVPGHPITGRPLAASWPWSPLELQIRGEAAGEFVVWSAERRVPVRADRRNQRLRLRIENAVQSWRVRFVGVQAVDVALTGAAADLTWRHDGPDTLVEFRTTGQGITQLTATVGGG